MSESESLSEQAVSIIERQARREADEIFQQFAASDVDALRVNLWIEQKRWPGFRNALVKLAAFQLIDWQGNPDPALIKAAQRCLGAAAGAAYPNRNLPPPQKITHEEAMSMIEEYPL